MQVDQHHFFTVAMLMIIMTSLIASKDFQLLLWEQLKNSPCKWHYSQIFALWYPNRTWPCSIITRGVRGIKWAQPDHQWCHIISVRVKHLQCNAARITTVFYYGVLLQTKHILSCKVAVGLSLFGWNLHCEFRIFYIISKRVGHVVPGVVVNLSWAGWVI